MVLLAWPEVWVLAGQNGWGEQATDSIYSRVIGFLCVQKDTFWPHQCPCNLPETNGDLPWGPQSPLVYHLSGWYSHLLQGSSQPPQETQGCLLEIGRSRTKTQAFKMWALPVAASLSMTHDFYPRSSHLWRQNWGYQELAHTHKCHRGPKFPGIHEDTIADLSLNWHAGGTTSVRINIRQKCGQKEGCHQVRQ